MKSYLEQQKERNPLEYERARLCVDVSTELRSALEEAGLTQRALAERLGVSPGLISRQLAGAENLSLGTLAALSFSLGLRCKVTLQPLSTAGKRAVGDRSSRRARTARSSRKAIVVAASQRSAARAKRTRS